MTRREDEIIKAAEEWVITDGAKGQHQLSLDCTQQVAFEAGCEWADKSPVNGEVLVKEFYDKTNGTKTTSFAAPPLISELENEISKLTADLEIAVTCLTSISKNSCCEPCREAGLWAKSALEKMGIKE